MTLADSKGAGGCVCSLWPGRTPDAGQAVRSQAATVVHHLLWPTTTSMCAWVVKM